MPIYLPATSPEDWKALLADPEKHWKPGRSAHTLAHSWQNAEGFPPEVAALFSTSGLPAFQRVEMLLAFPEHRVPLPPTRGHTSQNDLFVLAKAADGALVSITVEGKVSESFAQTVGGWLKLPTPGKAERLAFLQRKLRLENEIPSHIRYQLLHRLASAILEAERFNARYALMLVHSFSPVDAWFADFAAFLALFGAAAEPGRLAHLFAGGDISVYAGWVQGSLYNRR